MIKTKKYSKVPSQADLDVFTGMHCGKLYVQALKTDWRCPSCFRTAHQLVRWTEIRGTPWRERYGDEYGMGFSISMTKHHCHGTGRFPLTLICGDCNSADGTAKRKLGLPVDWSFSPFEIGQFVSVAPYSGATKIDYEKAMHLYQQAQQPHPGFWAS
jgi:hypothetical protein